MPLNMNKTQLRKCMPILFALLVFLGCEKQTSPQTAPSAQPTMVSIATPIMRKPIETRRYSGRIQAAQRVEVRARVKGYLEQVLFHEGSEVKSGEELYVIDPRTFQAEVDDAKADVERLEAELRVATQDVNRSIQLFQKNAVSAEEHDHRIAAQAVAQAALLRGRARLDTALLNMSFTRIAAPISGRTSRTMFTAGNLVGQNEPTLLTTIVQMDPLHLVFEVPEHDLLTYWGRSGTPSTASSASPQIAIRFGVDTDEGVPYQAVVDFRDTEVKPGTGTVLLRAVVTNTDRILSPGMFAKVEVSFSQRDPIPHLSESTVARDQQGHYVLTVTNDNKVQRKSVKTGPSHSGLIAISEGLTAADHIIVSGNIKVSPGMPVTTEIVELNQVLVAQGNRP